MPKKMHNLQTIETPKRLKTVSVGTKLSVDAKMLKKL